MRVEQEVPWAQAVVGLDYGKFDGHRIHFWKVIVAGALCWSDSVLPHAVYDSEAS